jgi:hypothetical protein
MSPAKRDELMFRILKRIQDDIAVMKREMADIKSEVGEGFSKVIRRIDQHRDFAVDRLRDHDRRLRRIERALFF